MRKQRNIVMLGFSMVGKTTICVRFVNDRFEDKYEPTFENSYSKTVVHNGENVDVVIKDTQGDEGESIFRNEYGLGYHGYVLVYSISSRRSLEMLKNIHEKLISLIGTSRLPGVLVGNKADLENDNLRQVPVEQGRALAEEWGLAFVECSAKTRTNVDRVFQFALTEIDKFNEPDRPSGNCLAACIDRCAELCEPQQGFFAINTEQEQFPAARASAVAAVSLGFLYAIAYIVFGSLLLFRSTAKGSDLLSYILFALSLVIILLSLVGTLGLRYRSIEFLKIYYIGLVAVILTELTVWLLVYDHVKALKTHSTLAIAASAVGGAVQLSAMITMFLYARLLAKHLPPDNLYSPPGGSVNNSPYASPYVPV